MSGTPTEERILPSASQIRKMLGHADLRGKTMIWLGVGLGLGAKDLAVIRVGQIAADAYDLHGLTRLPSPVIAMLLGAVVAANE